MPLGWDRYLRVHEVGTHTIAGTLACALVTAAAVHVFARPTRYSWLALSAWIGAASHVLLDLLSSARLRPGWPFVDTVVSVPLVAMADPWLLALCVAGPVALWVAGRSRGRRAGVAVLAVMAVFLLAKAALGILAFSSYRSASDRSAEIVLARAIEAKWASLNTWHVFDRTANRVRAWSASADGGAHEVLSWPVGPETTRRQRLAIAIDRSQFSSRARTGVCRDAASGRRPHAGALVGYPLLLGSGAARSAEARANRSIRHRRQADRVRALVRRRTRRRWAPATGDRQGRRLHADSRARPVSTNSTLAKGVPSPVPRTSTWKPRRAKQAVHSSTVLK